MAQIALKQQPAAPEIAGFVDAIAGQTIYGWAWDRKAAGERLTIRFRIDGEEIGSVTADIEREDLKTGGVGDGRHAFSFRVPPEKAADLDRLEVWAASPRLPEPVRLAAPPAAPASGGSATLNDIQDALRRLVHSQRILHRMVQGGLESQKPATAEASLDELRSAQAALGQQIKGLESFAVRIDGVVEELGASMKAAQRRTSDPAVIGLLVLSLVGVGGCLALELMRFVL